MKRRAIRQLYAVEPMSDWDVIFVLSLVAGSVALSLGWNSIIRRREEKYATRQDARKKHQAVRSDVVGILRNR